MDGNHSIKMFGSTLLEMKGKLQYREVWLLGVKLLSYTRLTKRAFSGGSEHLGPLSRGVLSVIRVIENCPLGSREVDRWELQFVCCKSGHHLPTGMTVIVKGSLF